MSRNDLMIEIRANTQQALREIENLREHIQGITQNTNTQGLDSIGNSIKNIALQVGGVVAVEEALRSVIETGAEFEKTISKLGAISGASANELQKMSDKARELGQSTQYSASEVAEAMNYQAMAGMKVNDILEATPDLLDLASVGQMDLARASDIATDTMTAFGLSAKEMTRIVDVMATITTNSNTNIEQLGEAFKNVAPVAHNLGLSIEQTSAMLGVLADSGRKGGDAGTHLKIILQRLASTTKPVIKGLKELGISAYDSNGKLKPMTETLKQIKSKLDGLSEQKRNEILKNLFGEEAIASANIILNNLDSMDNKLQKVANSSGQASKMAKQMNDNLNGDWKQLKSAMSELAITLYNELKPSLRDVTQNLTEFVKWVTEAVKSGAEFYKENKVLIDTIIQLGVAFIALKKVIAIWEMIVGARRIAEITQMISSLRNMRNVMMMFASVNPVFAALGVVIAGVTYYINELRNEIDKLEKTEKAVANSTDNFSDLVEDLYGKHFDKATKTLKLTNKELEDYKTKTKDLIEATKKQIAEVKKNSDGSDRYKNSITQLQRRLKQLNDIEKQLEGTEPFEEAKKSTQQQTEQVKTLTKAQQEYIKSLDNELQKQQTKNQTLNQWYQNELNKLNEVLQGTQEYYTAKEKLDTLYYQKLQQKQQKEIDEFKKTYESRVKTHENTIKQLEQKEKTLSDKIVAIQRDLANKLKALENERVHTIEAIEGKIHNIQLSNATDYQKFVDKKKQAEIALSKAKVKLKEGDLQEAKRYMSQYESLVSSLANTEIKENKKVIVSKEQSNKLTINGLKQLEGLENEYFNKKKQEEITLHNQKINQLKAQLEATKAQLQLEMQRLNLEKQLIELTTGKKIDIDTTPALNSIKILDKQIKLLDNQIKTAKDYKVDTKTAKETINTFKSDVTKDNLKVEVKAEYQKTQQELEGAIKNFESNPIETEIKADTSPAETKITSFKDIAGNPVDFQLNANDTEAQKTLNTLQQPISTTLTINVNATEAFKVISQLQQNTSSVHTIYIREVKQKALGGLIEPLKLATGGQTFRRVSGRIPGYDPNDSDDVPALLTRGEFVIKRDAVKHYGDDFLYRLNNKLLPKYATGGLVEWRDPRDVLGETKEVVKYVRKQIKALRDPRQIGKIEHKTPPSVTQKETPITQQKENTQLVKQEKKLPPPPPQKELINLEKQDYNKLTALDTLVNKLQELEKVFANTDKKILIVKEINGVNKLKEKIKTDIDTYNKEVEKENNRLVTKDEKRQIENKIIGLDRSAIDNKLIDLRVSGVTQQINKLEDYLEKVKNTKEMIRNRIAKLGVNEKDILPDDFNFTLDINRLDKFYSKLKKLTPLTKQDIQNRLNKIIENYATLYRQANYSTNSFGNAAFRMLRQVPKPEGWQFLQMLDIKDNNLAKKYNNILSMITPYMTSFKLGDEILNTTIQDYLKQHLPKFKNGGVIDGANGGKLNGYGGGDRNLALLEDGEFIVRKEAVSNYGVEMLQKLNNFKLPRFATGGYVGSMPSNSSTPSDLVNVNFNLPNGKSYGMQSSEEVARMLASEFKRMM